MKRNELLKNLEEIAKRQKRTPNWDWDHEQADQLLLEYINDPEITKAFYNIEKHY